MRSTDKPLVWLHGEIKTPPLSQQARVQAGFLLRCLQRGESVGMLASRPMVAIGPRCHELRIRDATAIWRIIYRIDADAIVLVEVFSKRRATTPKSIIKICKKRLEEYDNAEKQENAP